MKYIQIKKRGIEEWEILKQVGVNMTLEEAKEHLRFIMCKKFKNVEKIRFWDMANGAHSKVYTINKKAKETIGSDYDIEKPSYEHVDSPKHYNNYSKEVIDMMIAIYGKEKVAIFCEINAFKYRMRMGTKPGQDVSRDLDKEKWYLDKKNELKG